MRLVALIAAAALAATVAAPAEAAQPDVPAPLKSKKCKKAGKKKVLGAAKRKGCKRKRKGEPPVGPALATTITLTTYENGVLNDQVRGTISSPDPACASDARVVGLFEGTPPFGTAITQAFPVNGTLTFTFATRLPGTTVYARTDGGLVGSANCDAALSNPIAKP